MSVWRIQTRTSKGDISQYCLKNNIAAMGWSLLEYPGSICELEFDNFEDYCEIADEFYQKYGSVYRLANDILENDIIWMRSKGIYYCARVTSASKWFFDKRDEAREQDASNQLTNINWIKVGDESLPGALTTSFIKGQVLQRINKAGITEFSEITYDNLSNDSFKYNRNITLTKETFYNLISPSDCEDLLYMWLYKRHKNYVCIPSTNKIATEKYEFVILDVESRKHIYIQVKNGKVNLNADDYFDLVKDTNNEIYLLSTGGNVIIEEKYQKNHNIFKVDPEDLYNFACDEENQNYIPPNIEFWMQFAGGSKFDSNKGIMFDTNSSECENYMFENNVVAAWGSPKRYIKAFKNNDYVLYYRKGHGIISIGKIISNNPIEIKDSLEHNVDIMIPCKYDSEGKVISISPNEIKTELNKDFYFASTRKVPFLSQSESEKIISLLVKKQQLYN